MTWQSSAAASSEQTEPVGQSLQDLIRAEDSRSDRRELDGERQTVKPAAQIGDRGLIRDRQLELARCRRRPLRKETDRLVLSQLSQRLRCRSGRKLARRDPEGLL